MIAYFVGYWDDYVRPAVKLALDTIVVAPLRWLFSWHFEVPLVVRDYLSVGVIFGLSVLRALHRPGRPWRRKDAVTFLLCLLGWPRTSRCSPGTPCGPRSIACGCCWRCSRSPTSCCCSRANYLLPA
jgi:hypothetical protein